MGLSLRRETLASSGSTSLASLADRAQPESKQAHHLHRCKALRSQVIRFTLWLLRVFHLGTVRISAFPSPSRLTLNSVSSARGKHWNRERLSLHLCRSGELQHRCTRFLFDNVTPFNKCPLSRASFSSLPPKQRASVSITPCEPAHHIQLQSVWQPEALPYL